MKDSFGQNIERNILLGYNVRPLEVNHMNWWIYVIVFGALIAVFLISALIIRLLTKSAYKKANALYQEVTPKEKERYELILKAKKTMEDDGRFLPKSMIESTMEVEKEFQKIPCDISKVKSMNDFLIIYYSKYIHEKKLLGKYDSVDQELNAHLYADPQDKNSPYYQYNKAALKYNAFLNMGFINIFRGKSQRMPTL